MIVEGLCVGDVIRWPDWYERPDCTVTRPPELTHETIEPLRGRPAIRIWIRRTDTNDEGYVLFGPGAEVDISEREETRS